MDSIKTTVLIGELQKYDNSSGYKLSYKEAQKKLEPCMHELVASGESALDGLHKLLEHEETWSCFFALEILKEIKSEKSVPFLISFLEKNENGDFGESYDMAIFVLHTIGRPAIPALLEKIKKNLDARRPCMYLTEALTGIKDEGVYHFMVDVVEDYIKNYKRYDGWFQIHIFASDFDKQGNEDVLPILERLAGMEHLSKNERMEINGTIKSIRDPKGYKEEVRQRADELLKNPKELDRFKQLFYGDAKLSDKELKEIRDLGKQPDEDYKANFICRDCKERQNIKTGMICSYGSGKETSYNFAYEIMCRHCHSHSIELTDESKYDLFGKGLRVLMGKDKGISYVGDESIFEGKKIKWNKAYNYAIKRLEEEPENGELYLRAGNVARKFNRYEEAIRFYEKAIKLNPRLVSPYVNLIEIYTYRSDYYLIDGLMEKAKEYFKMLLKVLNNGACDMATIDPSYVEEFIERNEERFGVEIQIRQKKIGRNELCLCGSGLKYKKCHGKS